MTAKISKGYSFSLVGVIVLGVVQFTAIYLSFWGIGIAKWKADVPAWSSGHRGDESAIKEKREKTLEEYLNRIRGYRKGQQMNEEEWAAYKVKMSEYRWKKWRAEDQAKEKSIKRFKEGEVWKSIKRKQKIRFGSWVFVTGLSIAATLLLFHPYRPVRKGLVYVGFSIQIAFLFPILLVSIWAFIFEFEGRNPIAAIGVILLILSALAFYVTIGRKNELIRHYKESLGKPTESA